jgi:hypothetical protein
MKLVMSAVASAAPRAPATGIETTSAAPSAYLDLGGQSG